MDIAEILKYITVEKAYILIPALWIIGYIIKKIPKCPDWIIPFILLALGIIGAIGLIGLTVDAVIQGVLVAGVTVLTHQLIKQAKKKDT
jgi:hypothetical protein